jgi:ATP-dependent helicase HrpA
MLSPHLFMNFRVVDEHGRQLGTGRNLGALKAELGAQARGAFQALAGLKLAQVASSGTVSTSNLIRATASQRPGRKMLSIWMCPEVHAGQRHTAWTFGELPELHGNPQGRADHHRLPGADRCRRRGHDRGLR